MRQENEIKINDSIIELVKRDKKREKQQIHFVFLKGIGNAVVETIPLEGLIEELKKN